MVFGVFKGRVYGNNPADRFNSLTRRRIAHVAVQFGLGLLSERRIRTDSTHLTHIAAYGTDITPSGTVLDKSVGGHRFVTRVFSLGDDSYKAKFFRNAD